MDLLQLRYFQAVAGHEHVTRAAEELHVGQPSLSRTIARLESELGVPLFDRDGRRLRLNRFGAAFLARVTRPWASSRTPNASWPRPQGSTRASSR